MDWRVVYAGRVSFWNISSAEMGSEEVVKMLHGRLERVSCRK